MSARHRAAVAGFACVFVALALGHGAFAQPRAATPPATPSQAAGSPAAQTTVTDPWLARLTTWVRAVAEHAPGEKDAAALAMASATEVELEAIRFDYFSLLALHMREKPKRTLHGKAVYKKQTFRLSHIQEILGLTDSEARQSNANRILKRAAILHADVAMLVLLDMPWLGACSSPSVVLVRDGYQVGTLCSGIHWVMARALLGAVSPDPRNDSMVRLWYQATIAHLLENGDYANARRQIDAGFVLFPNDPGLLFQHGHYHETIASPQVHPAARASRMEGRPASAHLKEAEGHFRRALDVNPDLLEARVHHGVVLGALGRHDDAVAELRKAAASVQGPVLRYYAALFLGDEEQAVGGRDAARAAYDEAAALFPAAQAPRIALSHLARRYGDRSGALLALRGALTLPPDEGLRSDPWWTYHRWLNESAEVLLRELYRPFLAGGPQ